ncbi:MAG: CAP domain-containing protein [Kofleriaceae bacterium]
MRHSVVLAFAVAACGGTLGTAPGDDGGGDDDDTLPDGASPRADAPGGVGEPAALAGITLAHNEARAAVQTSPALPALTWSPELAATAAAWVAQCIDTDQPIGLVDHNAGRSTGHPYYVGENIFASGGQANPLQAVQLWVQEKSNYDYAANSCAGVCGHYTQVVWRETREVGCAIGTCAGLQFPSTIVCDYGPGGNVGGQRPY